jgi:hypothetical protein
MLEIMMKTGKFSMEKRKKYVPLAECCNFEGAFKRQGSYF